MRGDDVSTDSHAFTPDFTANFSAKAQQQHHQPLRTATPLSIHSGQSISSGEQPHVTDPFATVDPFERATKDPFSDQDPFAGDDDPFADIDPFGLKDKAKEQKQEVEFATHALSAEGVPLRNDSCHVERSRKLQVNVATASPNNLDPFAMTDADVQGKKLNTPLIGDGSKRASRDPFDTAFAAVSLNLNNQFASLPPSHSDSPAFDSNTNHFAAFNQSDFMRSPASQSEEATRSEVHHQLESDSTSCNSEVSEAFGTTAQTTGARGGQINPFLSSNQTNQSQIPAQVIHANSSLHLTV